MSGATAEDGGDNQATRGSQATVLPSVAVVVPCWNAKPWIGRAIQSVLDQDYPNLKLIVVDDGSTDGAFEVIKSFGDRLTCLTGPRAGPAEARNRGEAVSNSEFVLFLDADDYVEGPLVSGMVEAALTGGADLVLGPTVVENQYGIRSARTGCASIMPNPDLVRAWLGGAYVQGGGLFWRRSFFHRIGRYEARVRRMDDVEIGLRGLIAGAKVAISNGGVAVWFNHNHPSRQSRQVDDRAWRSILECLTRLGAAAGERYPGLESAFARELYLVARRAMAHGCNEAGFAALESARALGLRGHPGSPFRALLCRTVGMPSAEHLATGVRVALSMLKRAAS